ncbi:O-linked N-acetylglucosamine transferase, SPINDLY family protein [Laspinema olomoucense]|uniref:O-linked N-acetylglucosamine transferase, SPINDLY family protein n=1 Tax=Laspinema olomoucense TaxID=3231600 RepID=UPI0021BB20E2|nr:O-linked N-acetylglucosamine transferase, SPINDLY family protein [Laspinema sp. D3d]MCT7974677.1 O-linked N-acetylglucosamine transferase, SPINDLY family protein [Laspinema sp. D3d]
MENITNLEQTAYSSWMQGNYNKAAQLYEQAILANPEKLEYCWYLGLMFLLQEKEEEAHSTWLLGMMEASEDQTEEWTSELLYILHKEALRLEELQQVSASWLIRQHIREIAPTDIHNLLHLIKLAIAQEMLPDEELQEWQVTQLIKEMPTDTLDANLLVGVSEQLFKFAPLHPFCYEFAEVCLPHLQGNSNFRDLVLVAAVNIGLSMGETEIAISLADLCLRINAPHPEEILGHLATFHEKNQNYSKAQEAAKQRYALCESLPDKISANDLLIKVLLIEGKWEESYARMEQQESMFISLLQQPPKQMDTVTASRLLTATFYFPYFWDEPRRTRQIQNQVAELFQNCAQTYAKSKGYKLPQHRERNSINTKPLKIGYVSNSLRKHSVGWMARWLFQYHDHRRFEIYGYFVDYKPGDSLQEWLISKVDRVYKLGADSQDIATQIVADGIDILVDLDSLTLQATYQVMALKPAPIQVTWLGLDASGLPAIDYYLADPYVLPDDAEDYYCEKIWRFPQTYIAVDGFEVGVPTRRRQDLDIHPDAVVYYSGQTSSKRHPETARSQLKIIKEVSNSYFLIKTWPDVDIVKDFFRQLADAEGVERDRLRFLPNEPEETHRANLGIVDVVLDTYPYSGATTTFETLWMGIPIVTRVGEQWAARNSYTMMMNAGVTEGIAWTEEEYINWGIRLGNDSELRKQIYWRLMNSRKTAPLWNAEKFTRQMEDAYQQMWENYLQSIRG